MSITIPIRGTLQMAKLRIAIDPETGEGTGTILIPTAGRIIQGGQGAFDNPMTGDHVSALEILDPTGQQVVESFIDSSVEEINKGWDLLSGTIEIHALSDMRSLPGGYWLRIKVQKAVPMQDVFRCNLLWGKL